MVNSRRKGHNFERYLVNRLKHIFPQCSTSRYTSKKEDDNGIDLCDTGNFAFQAKSLSRMPQINEIFDHMKTLKQKVILFKHSKTRGKKGEYAIIGLDDFIQILEKLIL